MTNTKFPGLWFYFSAKMALTVRLHTIFANAADEEYLQTIFHINVKQIHR